MQTFFRWVSSSKPLHVLRSSEWYLRGAAVGVFGEAVFERFRLGPWPSLRAPAFATIDEELLKPTTLLRSLVTFQ